MVLIANGIGGYKDLLFSFIFMYSLSITLSSSDMIKILVAGPFYIQLTRRALKYSKSFEHRVHVSRYTVCSHTL